MTDSVITIPDCFYRVSIKGLCVREGKVLLIEEYDDEGIFSGLELPGGGMDFGESFEATFRREVQEEMGVTVASFSPRPVYVWTQQFPARPGRGAFCSLILAHQVEFESLAFTPSKECGGIRWLTPTELATAPLKPQCTPLRKHFSMADFA